MAKIFSKFRKGISKTREQVFGKISTAITRRRKIDDDLLEEIEEILIGGDVGVDTTLKIIEQVKMRIKKEKYEDAQDLFRLLQEEMAKILPEKTTDFLSEVSSSRPYIILVVGVNGVGKTTFIAKLAHLLKREGKSILLVAADTFRAAAIEQLQIWAERVGVELIRHQSGSDPGAVVLDALNAAKARGTD
ncbi:MAG: signal recognition particle receptor subunit alpha, partial [Calditrichia bacterium]